MIPELQHFMIDCLGPNGGSRNCSEPNGAPGFAQPNGGFTGLTVGARELTHRIALCKTFIYISISIARSMFK
jgi:hypothetical protein